jgi:hypothetical protein
MKHHPATITSNTTLARDIAKNVIGKSCKYADGRKNGIRYKWLFNYGEVGPLSILKNDVEIALRSANVKNFKVDIHTAGIDGLSVTVRN